MESLQNDNKLEDKTGLSPKETQKDELPTDHEQSDST
jgi:hypothetical protein